MATIKIKKKSIDVNNVLINVEQWLSEHDTKIKDTYKVVSPEAKSIKLTYSKNFDELLTTMLKDTKECKLLNALKADANMKLKSTYLADNNINALSLTKDKEGIPVMGYTDLRSDLVKDLGFLKTWTRREVVAEECRTNVKTLETSFPTVYDTLKNTIRHRNAIFLNPEMSTTLAEVFARLRRNNRNIESSIISSPAREKFPTRPFNRTAPFFTYLTFQQQGSWEVERITKYIQRLLINIPKLYNANAGNNNIGKDWEKIGQDFKIRFIDTGIVYNLIEDIVYYFDYSLTSMAELLDGLKDTKLKIEDFLIQLEDRNKILIQNFLSIIKSSTIFTKAILDMEQEDLKYETINGVRDSSRTLKNAGIIGMDFELAAISLDIHKDFQYMSRYGEGNLKYYLDTTYISFLKNLYAAQFRATCGPGKIASKLFNGHYTAVEVEEFTTLFKKHTTKKDSEYSIKIVEGALISHYYNEQMYSTKKEKKRELPLVEVEQRARAILNGRIIEVRNGVANQEIIELGNGFNGAHRGGGSLGSSCMKYARCYNQIQTYSENPKTIKLLVALDNVGKLAARAILWYHDNGKIYIDRVYAFNEKSRIDMCNWAEEHKFINIYYGNSMYNKELQFANSGERGLVFTVDNAIDNIPYFDTARRVDNRGIIALGEYNNSDINKANKKIQDIRKMNEELAKPAPNVEAVAIKMLNEHTTAEFIKKSIRKKYEFSKKYEFALKTSFKRKNEVAPRYTWMDLNGNRKRMLSSEYDMVLDFVKHNEIKKLKPVKPVEIITPKAINKMQLAEWKAEKASKLITTMNFLGAVNYRAA